MHLVAVGVLPYGVYKSAISFRSTLSISIFRKKALAIYDYKWCFFRIRPLFKPIQKTSD